MSGLFSIAVMASFMVDLVVVSGIMVSGLFGGAAWAQDRWFDGLVKLVNTT